MITFYKCTHCGNIIMFLHASGVIPNCCGDEMTKMDIGLLDEGKEKHLPVITLNNGNVHVNVGSIDHPMTEQHHIDWIVLETNKGMHIAYINLIDGKASASFTLQPSEKAIAAYSHCNLHGLWMAEV